MNNASRTKNSINNAAFSIGAALITYLLRFIDRTVFIRVLSAEYLGLRGLFSNVLSFLALAELGVGNAMNFALYKPLRDYNTEKVKSLMALYRHFYTAIGVIVLVLGASITPFLSFFIKDMPENIPDIKLYYLMFVMNSAVSYFFTYKRSLIICDQKQYISTIESLAISIVESIIRLIILVKTREYLAYLIISVFFTLFGNVLISLTANRLYPFIKERDLEPLDENEYNSIKRNISAMVFHKIGTVIVFSTDNLIISKYVGLLYVGLYSNYTIFINAVQSMIGKLFSASMASIGNLIASGDKDRCKDVLEHILFVNTWLYGFSGTCLFCLISGLITIWIGKEYLLTISTLIAAIVSFYLSGMRSTILTFKDAAGLFRPDRYKALIESAANIVFSIPLAIKYGITGVILGTILSTLLISFWYEAFVFYKYFFNGGFGRYIVKQLLYGILNAAVCGTTYLLCSFARGGVIASFIQRFAICMIVPNAVYYLFFWNSPHFKYFLEIACRIINRKKK